MLARETRSTEKTWRVQVFMYAIIGILLSTSLPVRLQSQKKQAPDDNDLVLKVPVELVLVPVTVEDKEGMPLAGLQKGDFTLLEEGIPQKISFFSVDPFPMSVAILVDRTNDAQTFSNLQQTLVSLTEAFSAFDEMAIYQFESISEKIQDFTSNKDEILKAFKRIGLKGASPDLSGGPFSSIETMINGIPLPNASGTVQPPKTINTHIDDAIFNAAIDLRRRSKDRRKVILVISSGQNAPGNRHSFDDTLEALTRTEVVVYGIGGGVSRLVRRSTLSRFAGATGGSVSYPVRLEHFAETYQRIALLARNQYVLGYLPNSEADKLSFRKIEVSVISKETKVGNVKHRKGYYAVPHP
jgi:VWFA-related protein